MSAGAVSTHFMYMNVPNSLTILRILLIPVYVGFLVYEQYDYALLVLFVAVLPAFIPIPGVAGAISGPLVVLIGAQLLVCPKVSFSLR